MAAKHHTIVMDPPWMERGGGQSKRGADRHYDLMSFSDIAATIAEPMGTVHADAHCWVWVTDNFLREGLGLLDAFGFRYIRTMQWVKMRGGKLQTGLGQYARGSHEMALLGVRGRTMLPPTDQRRPSVVLAERTRHSAKPAEAFDFFEASSPSPRLEVFARAPRPGWTVWGNESDGT